MSRIDSRLRRLQAMVQARPPDPLVAAVKERCCVALALAEMDEAECSADDPDHVPPLEELFFAHLARLRVIVPESLMDTVWRWARALPGTPQYVARLQVPPALRGVAIALRQSP